MPAPAPLPFLRGCAAVAAALLLPGCSAPPAPHVAPAARRAIVLSLDSFNEQRLRQSLPASAIPTIRELFEGGACATSARPAFPSVTAAGHASLWTGAYGDVNGITANTLPQLPRDRHTLLELASGFHPAQLRAEPLWITAALQGVATTGHHATQSPGRPGYPPLESGVADPERERLVARADSALGLTTLQLVNGYDATLAQARVLTAESHPPRPAPAWTGLAAYRGADRSVAPREVAAPIGDHGDSVFVLLVGTGGSYTHALIAPARDVGAAVPVWPHAAETADPRGRPLARHFSAPLSLAIGGRPARTHFRLFELSAAGTEFRLFHPAIAVIAANHAATAAGYERASAWVGNSATWNLVRGDFGPVLSAGGDGTAERRWLETAELMTRESIAATRWMWSSTQPRLYLDYFALGDDVDHTFWGFVVRGIPGRDAAAMEELRAIRAHAWALVDERVRAVRELARASGAALFVSGDHGMRATWKVFRPNVALARAGLLALDSAGRIALPRTRAVAPNGGYWISVNRAAWRDGTVAPADERAVIDSVVAVLRGVRDADGRPIVTRIHLAAEHDSLGIGGPNGGDVYYDLAPGYFFDGSASGELTADTPPRGVHGLPSVNPDMHTVLCASGPAFAARRIGEARTIDLAPTVLEWLGVRPAAAVRGRSLLSLMR